MSTWRHMSTETRLSRMHLQRRIQRKAVRKWGEFTDPLLWLPSHWIIQHQFIYTDWENWPNWNTLCAFFSYSIGLPIFTFTQRNECALLIRAKTAANALRITPIILAYVRWDIVRHIAEVSTFSNDLTYKDTPLYFSAFKISKCIKIFKRSSWSFLLSHDVLCA